MELFYAKGIRAVGVDTIALADGVTKRTLYYHFESKKSENGGAIMHLYMTRIRICHDRSYIL